MTCADLAVWVNETLGLEEGEGYKEGITTNNHIFFSYFLSSLKAQ